MRALLRHLVPRGSDVRAVVRRSKEHLQMLKWHVVQGVDAFIIMAFIPWFHGPHNDCLKQSRSLGPGKGRCWDGI